ncbi:MAG: NF038122 family metalloprotease [Acidobacteria bacterium]|nr:NF038122 family metalloprotease [Acidobacteriota bacterium]
MRSTLFLTLLGCLLAAGLAGTVFRPASAARFIDQPAAAPQNKSPQIQEIRATPPLPHDEAQDHLHSTPLEGGSVLELRNGRMHCRATTVEEARAMRRDPDQRLRVIGDESFAKSSIEQTQKGLKIILRGTPQLEQFPEARAAFLRAARAWESLIQNPITVVIDVDFGPTNFGEPFEEYRYAETRFQRSFIENAYPIIRSALIDSAGSPQEASLYKSLPPAQLPTDLGATTEMIFHGPAMRALGLFPPVADPDAEMARLGPPPRIGFNSAIIFDFDPSDGIKPEGTDFVAAAMHEIGHALGFFSTVGNKERFPNETLIAEVLDLFRFRPGVTFETFATTPRILSSGGEQIFFGGGPELQLSTGRTDYTGGDGSQAGHWKDDIFTGRYIGIMDPTFDDGLHYEMTANDREAFELIGYRMNPLPNPREAELKVDVWALNRGLIDDGLMMVNRLTPPSYPATLRKLRILIPDLEDMPDPTGKPITLLIYAQPNANGKLPPGAQFTRIETTVPSASNDLFLEFTIPNGPTIYSGDFYVGYQAPSPHQAVGFAVDLSGSAENRSFYSENNGASFTPLAVDYPGKAPNAMIRAIVYTPNPAPAPGPATVALASGVSQNGTITSSDPEGSIFETQYTIDVPSGATQLKIELLSDTDLDLYARFGSRVEIKNGDLVVDFKAVSYSNRESIIITPSSSPALQTGVYYLMFVSYGSDPSNFKITATVTFNDSPNPTPGKVVSVSAASYNGASLASEAITAAFGTNLAKSTQEAPFYRPLPTDLDGTRVTVTDSNGTKRTALLFFASSNQVNYQIPVYTAPGPATVTVTSGDGTVSVGTVQITAVAPGLFTANGDGRGAPAGYLVRVKPGKDLIFEPIIQYDSAQRRFVSLPIDLGEETDGVLLVLFGTGLRNHQGLSGVSARIGGVDVPVFYAGAQGNYFGLDQVNVYLYRSLIGRGEVELELRVDNQEANRVQLRIR